MKVDVNVDKDKYVDEVKVVFTPLEFLVFKKSLQFFIENNENTDDTIIAWDMFNSKLDFNFKVGENDLLS